MSSLTPAWQRRYQRTMCAKGFHLSLSLTQVEALLALRSGPHTPEYYATAKALVRRGLAAWAGPPSRSSRPGTRLICTPAGQAIASAITLLGPSLALPSSPEARIRKA